MSTQARSEGGAPSKTTKKRWWEKVPHTYVILFFMMVVAALLTYVLPAGEYERQEVEGLSRPVIVPDSYHPVEGEPTGFLDLFTAIPRGMLGSGQIIFLILLSSAAFSVINHTQALSNSIGAALRRLRSSKLPGVAVIWIVTFLFSLLGVIVGPEIQIPFTIVGVTIALGLGYDLIVGLGMILGGGYMGFNMGPINASILGTAHSIVGLPVFSGQGFRWIMWFACTCLVASFTSLYARKVAKNPNRSLVQDVDTKGLSMVDEDHIEKMTGRHWCVLAVLLGMLTFIILGASLWEWYLDEMSAVFTIGGLAAGLIFGLKVQEIIDAFIKGISAAAPIAVLLGLARATQVILEDGRIMDTIIYHLSGALSNTGPYVAAILISLITAIVHFFIPSGSALAVSIMPVLGPLGTLAGLTPQTTVTAFQIGATLPNWVYPTVGATMAMIGIARVPFDRWLVFALKLTGLSFLLSWVFLMIAVAIGY